MPALNFKKQFAPLVASGQKKQTIRAKRKRPFRANEVLFLYTGMRTKNCTSLLNAICKSVEDIVIHSKEGWVKVNNKILTIQETMELAKADGFDSDIEFYLFFESKDGKPFIGQLIKWD